MSRLYDTVEPSVIDEEMLNKAVEEQGPKDEAGKLAKQEGIDFKDVKHLRLDFKNILKIDGLWEFVNLTKLQLDNNIIEKIEGLDVLIHIIWLDLSFNNIEVIEGLDKLTKIKDLTLYNNRISRLESMDTLMNLEVFSIGNNDLSQLENVLYLRRFKKLQTLNLSNNPFCQEENYRKYLAAYLPNLEYLDYRLLDKQTKISAYEAYTIQVDEINDTEKKEEKTLQDEAKAAKDLETHKRAYVEYLNSTKFFDSMFVDDPEGDKLREMPGFEEIIIVYSEKFNAICMQIFIFGLKELEKRDEEVAMFWECIEEAKAENKEMCVEAIEVFFGEKKQMFEEFAQITDADLLEQKVTDYNARVTELWDVLMGYEMQLVDQLEDGVQNFDRNMQDLVSNFIENFQGYLAQVRESENNQNERVLELCAVSMDKFNKNEIEDDISDELRMMLMDKDTMMNSVSSSHDAHLLRIDNKEDDIITRINNWQKTMIETIHEEEEIKRNRARVSEINHFIDHQREELDNLEMSMVPM